MPPSGGFPAGQHFIPKMLQKRFADGEGKLWAFDRRRPGGAIFRTTVKDVFRERHLYTMTGPDGAPSPLVERTLGRYEDAADLVIDRVVAHVRAGGSYDLTADERTTLLLFLYVQHKRCPEFFRDIAFDGPIRAFAERAITAWESLHGPVSAEERERHLAPGILAVIEQSARMGALMSISPDVFGAFQARGFAVVHITCPGQGFILASLPTVRCSAPSGRQDLGDPGAELWLPVAPDVAIVSCGPPGRNQVARLDRGEAVQRLNEQMARQSTTIASASRDRLRSLIGQMSPSAPSDDGRG